MDVSVIIPAHNEGKYLNKTIENIFATAKSEIEVIVILNGYKQRVDPRAEVIKNKDNLGIRVAINQGAAEARGKYLYRIDGHCTFESEEWDLILMKATKPQTISIPALVYLTKSWKKVGHPKYTCRLTPQMTEEWYGLANPEKLQKNMCHTGCGIFLEKAFFDSFGGLDESLPKMGRDGAEFAIHAWLDGDGMFTVTDVVLGHVGHTGGYNTQWVRDAEKGLQERFGNRWQEIADHFQDWDHTPKKGVKTAGANRSVTIDRTDTHECKDQNGRVIAKKEVYFRYVWIDDGTESHLTEKEIEKKYAHLAVKIGERNWVADENGRLIKVKNSINVPKLAGEKNDMVA